MSNTASGALGANILPKLLTKLSGAVTIELPVNDF